MSNQLAKDVNYVLRYLDINNNIETWQQSNYTSPVFNLIRFNHYPTKGAARVINGARSLLTLIHMGTEGLELPPS